jgi:hypothetical protein
VTGNFRPTCKFLWRTLVHKHWVFLAGLRTKAPIWRLVIHDWTKFTPAEAPHYGRRHYGAKDDILGFVYAWNHHSKLNPHHWEFWIPVTAHRLSPVKAGKPLPMPEWAVREMVADWLGASKSYEGFFPKSLETWSWYHDEKRKLKLHDETWVLLERVLSEYFLRPLLD